MTSAEPIVRTAAPRSLPYYAKLERSIVVMGGLFRTSFDSSDAVPAQVELSVRLEATSSTVYYRGPQLSVPNLRVLQALLAIASTAPRNNKRPKEGAEVVECSYNWLARVAGYSSPGSKKVNALLERALAQLGQGEFRKEGRGPAAGVIAPLVKSLPKAEPSSDANLPSASEQKPRRSGLRVELHPLLSVAVQAGKKRTHFLWLDMDEVRALENHPSRLLHHRLCHMNPGEKTDHGLDTLASYISSAPPDKSSRSRDDHGLKRALAAIKVLEGLKPGWVFKDIGTTYGGATKYEVHRPVRVDVPSEV